MKITSKYVLREHWGPLAFALSALTSLLLLNYIARRFGDLVGKGLPWRVIGEFVLLSLPFTAAMTLPMAVLVAVLYAFNRLSAENEVTAFKASGVAIRAGLLAPVLWASLGIAGVMLYFNDQVLPNANHRLTVLLSDIARTRPTFALREQVLNELNPQLVVRAARVDQARSAMRDVTIYDLTQSTPRTIRADSGTLALAQGKTADLVMTLYDGSIVQVGEEKPGQLQRTAYRTLVMRQRDFVKGFSQTGPEGTTYKSDREMTVCELQNAYMRSRREYLEARLEFEQAVADSLKKPRPQSLPRRKVFLGIGRLYCQALAQVQQVTRRGAQAALPKAAGAMPTRASLLAVASQDTARPPARPDSARPQPAPVTPAPTVAPPTPVPSPVPSAQPAVPTQNPSRADTAAPVLTNPVPVPVAGLPMTPSDSATLAARAAGAVPPGAVPPGTIPPAVPAAAAPGTTPGATPGATPSTAAAGISLVSVARLRLSDTGAAMNGYDIEIHKKFALAVACIVFVLLGAPVAVRFPRGGVGFVIGVSLFVFALYYCFLIGGEALAQRGVLPPWIAMWAANALFGTVGLLLALRMGNERASNRGGGIGDWLATRRHRRELRRAERARAEARRGSLQGAVGSSRVDLQACKLEYSIVSPK